jgi:hypothetical protein
MGSSYSSQLHICHIREEHITCESDEEAHNHTKYYVPTLGLEFYMCRGNIIMYRCLLSTDEFRERYLCETPENTFALSDSMYESICTMRHQLRMNANKFNKQLLCDILDWRKFQIKNDIKL